ncbi:MAG: hemolysin family protein [Bacteroidota bacterium]
MDSDSTNYLIIIISLVFSAFFSGMELAYLSSNRLKVELDKTKGTFTSKIIGTFYSNESNMITCLLLGNNISLVLFGLASSDILNPIINSFIYSNALVLITQTILSTLLVLFVAEFLPKAIVQLNPNRFLMLGSSFLFVLYVLLYIPSKFMLFISGLLLRISGTKVENNEKIFNKVDLEHFIQEINTKIPSEAHFGNEIQILQNALDFSKVKARDCMIPRTEIMSVDVEDSIEELSTLFISSGLSKIIVYRNSIDNIIGYVHSFEIFKRPQSIKQILMPITFVPEAIPGSELLELFTKQSGNIAVVVDEYGGTSGLITIEDIIEEIFGEIEDEHDKDDWYEEKINVNEYLFSGRVEISYINKIYELDIPESEEYDTLGGLIIHTTESIPDVGAHLKIKNKELFVEKVSDRKIELVRILLEK